MRTFLPLQSVISKTSSLPGLSLKINLYSVSLSLLFVLLLSSYGSRSSSRSSSLMSAGRNNTYNIMKSPTRATRAAAPPA